MITTEQQRVVRPHHKNRSRPEIVNEILECIYNVDNRQSVLQSYIMYKCMLATNQINEYLPLLLKNDLISYTTHKNHKFFTVTTKGLIFLKLYSSMKDDVPLW